MVLAMTAVGTLVAVGLLVVVYHRRRPMVSRWSSPRNKPWLREYRTLVEPSGRGMSFAPDGIEMTWNDSTHADARRCAPMRAESLALHRVVLVGMALLSYSPVAKFS